jgi:hypothetical protein
MSSTLPSLALHHALHRNSLPSDPCTSHRMGSKKVSYIERLKMPSRATLGREAARVKREADAAAAKAKMVAEAEAEAAAAAAEAEPAAEEPAAEE